MNLSSMEYFAVLARERSFTKAAEKLYITQQSLSSHIASLEKELGCRLLIRHIPLELTYAGEVFLRYAESICHTQTDMLREFNDISQNQKGVLRIGAASSRGRAVLPPAILRFQQQYPNIRVDLTEGANDFLCQMLRQGDLDLAIADFPDTLPDICVQEFYQEETMLFINRGLFERVFGDESGLYEARFRSGDFSALIACPLVLGTSEDVDGRIAAAVLKRAGIRQPVVRAVSHNVGMLLSLCSRGIGACFCPENLAAAMLTADEYRNMMVFSPGDDARTCIRFGYQSRSYQWSVIEAFMKCARS